LAQACLRINKKFIPPCSLLGDYCDFFYGGSFAVTAVAVGVGEVATVGVFCDCFRLWLLLIVQGLMCAESLGCFFFCLLEILEPKPTLFLDLTNSTGKLQRNDSETLPHLKTSRGKWADSIGQVYETAKNLGQSQHNPHQVTHQPFVNMSSARSHRKKRNQERYSFLFVINHTHQKQILWVQIPPVSFGNLAHPHGCKHINLKHHLEITKISMTSMEN
jgi:hypothetical protein